MEVNVIDKQDKWFGASMVRRSLSLKNLFIPPQGQKVVPTSAGIVLILIGLSLGLAAYNTENNILFAAFSALLSSIIISGIVCWGNFKNLAWRLETGETYRVGEEGEVTLRLKNLSNKFSVTSFRFNLNLEEQGLAKPLFLAGRLECGRQQVLTYRFKPSQRSVTRVELEDVASSFPFGFLSKHISGYSSHDIVVWPKRIKYSKFSAGIGGVFWQGSNSKEKGMTGELLSLRKYERGDAPKMINWKASARQQKLMVKQNALEKQSLYSIYIDASNYLWQNNEVFENMCSFAASLAEDLFRMGKLERCSIKGIAVIKIKRVVDLESFFDELARLQIDQSTKSVNENGLPNSIVFSPIEAGSVGAFINGSKIAQA